MLGEPAVVPHGHDVLSPRKPPDRMIDRLRYPVGVGADRGPWYRRATPEDAVACHELMWSSVTDLGRRQGTPLEGTAADWWRSSEPLNRFLAQEAAEWWVAQLPASEQLVGFARSIERDGLFELTEFFVRPDQQARGIGHVLLER